MPGCPPTSTRPARANQGGLQRDHIYRRGLQLDRVPCSTWSYSRRARSAQDPPRGGWRAAAANHGAWQWRLELEAHKRASASLLQMPAAHQQRAQEGLVPAARAYPRRRATGAACGARAAPAAPHRVRCVAARSSEQVRPQSACTGTSLGSEALICALLCAHGAAWSDAAVATVV